MKIAKYVLSGAAFLLAIGAAFSSHIKVKAQNHLTQIRWEQISTIPCQLVTRQCSSTVNAVLCAVDSQKLKQTRTCTAPREETFVYQPQ